MTCSCLQMQCRKLMGMVFVREWNNRKLWILTVTQTMKIYPVLLKTLFLLLQEILHRSREKLDSKKVITLLSDLYSRKFEGKRISNRETENCGKIINLSLFCQLRNNSFQLNRENETVECCFHLNLYHWILKTKKIFSLENYNNEIIVLKKSHAVFLL